MYTIEDILKLEPCKEYTKEKLEELWKGKKTLSRRDILKLNIPIDDRNWVIPMLVSVDTVVEWAQYCADTAKKHASTNAAARYADAAGYADAARYAAAARYADAAGYAARSAAAKSAAAARATADAAGDRVNAAAWSVWDKTRDKELYRLLTVLCDMAEKRNESK